MDKGKSCIERIFESKVFKMVERVASEGNRESFARVPSFWGSFGVTYNSKRM